MEDGLSCGGFKDKEDCDGAADTLLHQGHEQKGTPAPEGPQEGLGAIPVLPKPPERGLCPSPAPQRAGPSLCAPAARRLPGGKARPGRAAGESLMRNELEQNL